jgi:intracellular sulfur oxidation DsrE/DsrF family protein
MPCRLPLIAVLAVLSAPVHAGEPLLGPAIEGYGPTYPIDDRDVPLEDGFVYRAVFDIASYGDEIDALNPRFVSVARYLNMHARNGVPVDNMQLAVVVHGASVRSILNNEAYRSRYRVDNPNLELVTRLHSAGVRIYVCGQSLAFGNVAKGELASPVEVALSAMTMLTVLQTEGYAVLP